MKFFSFLLSALLMVGIVYAQTSEEWAVDSKTGCRVHNPYPKPNETVEYFGNCKNGFADGPSTTIWYLNGAFNQRVEINYTDGKSYEQGTLIDRDGNKYVGEFQAGRFQGQGTYSFANGNKYVGGFQASRLEGQGAYTYANGNKYVGEFKDGRRNGKGTLTYPDGRRQIHEWKDGRRNGLGIRYNADGSIESSGTFADNELVNAHVVDPGFFRGVSPLTTQFKPEVNQQRQKELEERARQQERLGMAELEAERKRREELEEKLRIALQQRPLIVPVQQAMNAYALVIGNAAYSGSGRLENPVNDSRAIGAKLRSMGFKVTEVEDANRAKLVTAFAQFSRSAASADLSVLFYSGHGVQLLGTNYILPTDIDQSDLAQATIQGVSLDSVIGQFLPGKTKLVFLDACRDNPLYQMAANRSVNRGLAPISVAEGTLIAYATKDGQVASDGGKGTKNSPFTVALLEHLSDPDDIAVVLRRVREKVKLATGGKQVPWDYGSLTGGALILSTIKATESKK